MPSSNRQPPNEPARPDRFSEPVRSVWCDQARDYIEFNDRYAQASTYHQLGMVTEEQRQWAQARQYYLRSLETYHAAQDTHNLGIVLRSLARLWQASGTEGLPEAMASILQASPEEVEALLRRILTGEEGQGSPEDA